MLRFFMALAMLAPSAPARSPFDGDWVADLDTQSGLPTDIYLLRDGLYACESCSPRRIYAADGRLRPVPGDPDAASESVRVAGPHAIVTHSVSALLDRTTTMTVAPDGRTATYVSIDHRPGIASALRTVYLARRTAPAPPGAHAVSGTWQGVRYVIVPTEARTISLRVDGDQLSYSTPFETSFSARFGGPFVGVHSAQPSNVEVAVRRIGERQLEERVRRGGTDILLRLFTVSQDGQSLEVASTDLARGITFRAISRRQRRPG